jgi:large subunit ribosomal protein L28
MGQKCEICGKTVAIGKQVTTRGKAKYLGGVGTKVTGISPRQFRPNLQRIRITDENGTPRRARVCVQCIRSGRVTKRIKNRPFELPPDAEALLAVAREKKAKRKGGKKS